MDTDVYYTSNDTRSSPTCYIPTVFFCFFLLLFTTLSYKAPVMYFE